MLQNDFESDPNSLKNKLFPCFTWSPHTGHCHTIMGSPVLFISGHAVNGSNSRLNAAHENRLCLFVERAFDLYAFPGKLRGALLVVQFVDLLRCRVI